MSRTDRWLFATYIFAFCAVLTGFGAFLAWDRAQWQEKQYQLSLDLPTNVTCHWQHELAQLPDPTRKGVMVSGIGGQIFLYAGDGHITQAEGNLYITASDETPRSEGQPAAKSEMWHFDPSTLKRLATKDEKGDDCYAIFLPWPKEWSDVRKIRLQAKFKSSEGKELNASETTMEIELPTPPKEGKQ